MSAPSMVGAEEVGLSFGAFGEDISRERGAKEPHSSIDFVYCTHMCFQLWSRREERDHLYDCTYTRSLRPCHIRLPNTCLRRSTPPPSR